MQELESYGNVTILKEPDAVMPLYKLNPAKLDDESLKILRRSDKLLSEVELETIRKEPDIDMRKTVLKEFLRIKLPKEKNQKELIKQIISKVIGYGELGELVEDEELEEIMVNGVNMPVFIFHRKHGMCKTNITFKEPQEVLKIINRLCWVHGEKPSKIVNMATIDGNRINITRNPIALHGPTLTIRKQRRHFYSITELIKMGTLDVDLAGFLWLAVDGLGLCPANIVIAGSIGSGKTTTLNALSVFIPPTDRVITIEDTPELRLQNIQNWVPLTTDKEHDLGDLLVDTLRMRPDRLIVGEIQREEAMTLFNAMNVGHKGMGTVHASSPRDVIRRFESPPMNVPTRVVENLDLILVQNRFNYRGKTVRRITEVAEVSGREKETIRLGTIYAWDPGQDKAVETTDVVMGGFLDHLSEKTKLPKKEIFEQLNLRKNVLKSMVQHSALTREEVGNVINSFYREREKTDK